MSDITEDLLQTLAAGDPIAMLLVATAGKPVGRELRAIAAELRAARADINMAEHEADHALNGKYFTDLCDAVRMLRTERDAARAQLREVAASGVEAETRQYVTVQISPETWAKIQEVARG